MALTKDQLNSLFAAIQYRTSIFPRAELRKKLEASDKAFHLSKLTTAVENSNPPNKPQTGTDSRDHKNAQDYSRFQEIQNGLTREIAETFAADYVNKFLGKSQVFSMTSKKDKLEDAQRFNTIFNDQSRQTGWHANLVKFFIDVSKYNIAAVDTYWGSRKAYTLTRPSTESKLQRTAQTWAGNHIEHLDMYNTMFDMTVPPEKVSEEGEWAGYLKLYSQVQLKKLIDRLEDDPLADAYIHNYKSDAPDPNFSIYTVTGTSTTGTGANENTNNMDFYAPDIVTHEAGQSAVPRGGRMNWLTHLGVKSNSGDSKTKDKSETTQRYYTVGKYYLRIIPSAYGMKTKDNVDDDIEIWEVYILEGTHILGTKKLTNAHELLGIDIALTDSDSTGFNASGPTQISIPYTKLAKQLNDRVLAGADRAIADRAIFDSTMLDKNAVNSKVPDAKMELKRALPNNKSITDFYHSIPYDNNATVRLNGDRESVEAAGRRASGQNNAQQGQFQPGNKTLFEYQDVMANAGDKTLMRTLFLEHTVFASIKRKLKLNTIQFQDTAKLYDPDTQEEVEINPSELYQSRVDFQLIDALMPNEFVMSPNVQQTLFTMFAQIPQAFQKYDVAGIVAHILTQSHGINMKQYELETGDTSASNVNQGNQQ